jgi:hypothetical protein
LPDSPEVSVRDQTGFLQQLTSQVDTAAVILDVVLGLALIIALLSIVNALTCRSWSGRELGLLRAVGMGRAQIIRMISVESIVIATTRGPAPGCSAHAGCPDIDVFPYNGPLFDPKGTPEGGRHRAAPAAPRRPASAGAGGGRFHHAPAPAIPTSPLRRRFSTAFTSRISGSVTIR